MTKLILIGLLLGAIMAAGVWTITEKKWMTMTNEGEIKKPGSSAEARRIVEDMTEPKIKFD